MKVFVACLLFAGLLALASCQLPGAGAGGMMGGGRGLMAMGMFGGNSDLMRDMMMCRLMTRNNPSMNPMMCLMHMSNQ